MLESGLALLVTLATGGIISLVGQRWQRQYKLDHTHTGTGSYSLATPGKNGKLLALKSLSIQNHTLILYPQETGCIQIMCDSIQWVSTVQALNNQHMSITLHLEENTYWHLLELQLERTDMMRVIKWLRRLVPASRLNTGKLPQPPIGPVNARVVEEDWHGMVTPGADVALYLLPNLLIVLRGNEVQAKLATRSIRRVLAVERDANKLDSILQRNTGDGLIRLYSMTETAVFLVPRYIALAEAIGNVARCPVEHITREDKTGKI